MEKSEPLFVIFGVPAFTTALILIALWCAGSGSHAPVIHMDAKILATPEVKAVLPEGAVTVTNNLPALQVTEIVRERVQVPDVKIQNNVQASEVKLVMPSRKEPLMVEVVNLPGGSGTGSDRQMPEGPDSTEHGALLPPPKAAATKRP
jgi:hypothetical protein